MKFCIATVDYWKAVGFDTTYWRTSVDGKLAMCHEKFASTVIPNTEFSTHIDTYSVDSTDFKNIVEKEFTEEDDDEMEGIG